MFLIYGEDKITELSFDDVTPGTISFRPHGICTNGESSYIGLINPPELKHKDKFFLELMGGAVCFSEDSCTDKDLIRWTSLKQMMRDQAGQANDDVYNMLASGISAPITMLKPMNPGYFPYDDKHPLSGRLGIFFPSCNADIALGRHDIVYSANYTGHHHGGLNMRTLLNAVKKTLPELSEFHVLGGSGGGVAAAAWGTEIADMWPTAKVKVLVDSGFHMMPGTRLFEYFYDHIRWSPGPGGQQKGMHKDVKVPQTDWRLKSAIADAIAPYNGRVKIAYIGCDEDYIIDSQREMMAKYVSDFKKTDIDQAPEMWAFVTSTHKCAPDRTVYSYIMKCDDHHYTSRDKLGDAPKYQVDNVTLDSFIVNFFNSVPPDPKNPDRVTFWFEEHSIDKEGVCKPVTAEKTSSTGETKGEIQEASPANFETHPSSLLLAVLVTLQLLIVLK